jgi:hypothetical protein
MALSCLAKLAIPASRIRCTVTNNISRAGSIDTPSDHISMVISIGNEKSTAPAKPLTICRFGWERVSIGDGFGGTSITSQSTLQFC